MEFTNEEKKLIIYSGQDRQTSQWGFYVAVLFPIFAFAAYGFYRNDLLALGLSFASLLVVAIWYIAQEGRYADVFHSIHKKLAEQILNDEKKNDESA